MSSCKIKCRVVLLLGTLVIIIVLLLDFAPLYPQTLFPPSTPPQNSRPRITRLSGSKASKRLLLINIIFLAIFSLPVRHGSTLHQQRSKKKCEKSLSSYYMRRHFPFEGPLLRTSQRHIDNRGHGGYKQFHLVLFFCRSLLFFPSNKNK